MPSEPTYFGSPAELRKWFGEHAGSAGELVIGFMKTRTGAGGITWAQAVDEALCVGWIDSVRHRIDDERYRIRFTPRKARSNWSAVNIRRVAELEAEGRMTPAGRAAFAKRTETRSRTASYEQADAPELADAEIKRFKLLPGAWEFYVALPASYRKKITWWVVSAKQESTRYKRLSLLLDACACGRRL